MYLTTVETYSDVFGILCIFQNSISRLNRRVQPSAQRKPQPSPNAVRPRPPYLDHRSDRVAADLMGTIVVRVPAVHARRHGGRTVRALVVGGVPENGPLGGRCGRVLGVHGAHRTGGLRGRCGDDFGRRRRRIDLDQRRLRLRLRLVRRCGRWNGVAEQAFSHLMQIRATLHAVGGVGVGGSLRRGDGVALIGGGGGLRKGYVLGGGHP